MILVIGEALIDMIEDRENEGSFKAAVGGANLNVAVALSRRGTPVQFLARLSNDRFGTMIREKLVANHVGLEYAIDASELTTLVTVSIDAAGQPTYSFYVNGTADWGWTPSELPTDADLENIHATAIQLGCLTMAMEPGNLVVEAWARAHYEQNSVTISHDVNLRPALGFEVGKERTRVERINAASHLIKASDEDIAWLYGLDLNKPESAKRIDEIAAAWIGGTERIVLVTRGAAGTSIYRSGRNRIDVASRKIQVVDTVGAGDTFCANLLGQLRDIAALGADPFDRLANLTDADLSEFVRIAGIAASITCERLGPEPPTLDDLNKVLESLA